MKQVFGVIVIAVASCLFQGCDALRPILVNGTLGSPLQLSVNKSVEFIIEFDPVAELSAPLRVYVNSTDARRDAPLLVVVRHLREVLSWELPLNVDDSNGGTQFMQTARTLCYDRSRDNQTLSELHSDDGTLSIILRDMPIISISTLSEEDVNASILLLAEQDFFIEPSKEYEITITPSQTRFYFYDFPDNSSITDNTKTVLLEVTSEDDVCMIISIQNATCPVHDLNNNIKFEGYHESVNRKGGITIPKSKFPNGFFVVFVPKADDLECTENILLVDKNRNKTIRYIIKPSISYSDYVNAVIATACCTLLFYICFGVSFFLYSNRNYIPRTMEYMSNTEANTPTTTVAEPDFQDNISYDETEYDTIAEDVLNRDDILDHPEIFLTHLARKDFRILKRKSYSYLWHVLTVALFYGLPVIQLVISYQKVLNDTGNQDLCYYNFLCAHPLGFLSDFNHVFSNIGYVFLGFLFLWIVYRREKWHKDNSFDQQYGIPQHYGLFYAMGIALCMEGVLSGGYHICPNHSNFQFDTSFMYVIAVLCMVTIYQTRHPDINATAYSTFGLLAMAILLGMVGILEANLLFWASFTVLHILLCLVLSTQIYYMGCWTCDRMIFRRIFTRWTTHLWADPLGTIKPKRLSRFILLLIGNICNWLLAVLGLYTRDRDFATYLLGIFMMNTLLYFIFYIIMKLLHKERINFLALLFMTISFTCAGFALYCFRNKSISWALTPAGSRLFNQECKLVRFYDYHDIWHFLSAIGMFFIFMVLLLLDDDLSHTHRSKIPVF